MLNNTQQLHWRFMSHKNLCQTLCSSVSLILLIIYFISLYFRSVSIPKTTHNYVSLGKGYLSSSAIMKATSNSLHFKSLTYKEIICAMLGYQKRGLLLVLMQERFSCLKVENSKQNFLSVVSHHQLEGAQVI